MKLAEEMTGMSGCGNPDAGHGIRVPPVLSVDQRASVRGSRVVWAVFWVVAVAMGLVVLHEYAPDVHGFYPRCGMYVWSGLHCPGCGSLRAVHHLTHGRLLAALDANALLVVGIGGGMLLGGARVWRGRAFAGKPVLGQPGLIWVSAGLLLLFTLLRNLPWIPFTWLAP
jgi:hypothetical protein